MFLKEPVSAFAVYKMQGKHVELDTKAKQLKQKLVTKKENKKFKGIVSKSSNVKIKKFMTEFARDGKVDGGIQSKSDSSKGTMKKNVSKTFVNRKIKGGKSKTKFTLDEKSDAVVLNSKSTKNRIKRGKSKLVASNEENGRVSKSVFSKRKTKAVKSTITSRRLPEIKKKVSSMKYDKAESDDSEALELFKWLIAPISPTDFLKTYWERQPLHIIRKKPKYYSHLFDSINLDKIFRDHLLFYTKNVDVVSYQDGTKEVHNQEGRAIPTALWDYYTNGCSIRVLNPQTYNRKVHILIATLQEYFGSMVGANVYLTPPGSQGFAPHYDDIEAFVVQLEGRKHWKLYQPKNSEILTRESSPNLKRENIGEPFLEITLEAGDLLYFPRGVIHEGSTDEDTHSLHITVSVYQHTAYVDLLEYILPNALSKAAENDIEFRKGLPLNYLKHFGAVNKTNRTTKNRTAMSMKVTKLIQTLIKYIDIDHGVDKLGQKLMYDSMPPVLSQTEAETTSKADGDRLENGKVLNRIEISLDTKVRLLRYYCIRLVVDEQTTSKLYYNTENANVYHGEEEQWLELDNSMVAIIKTLQNAYPKYLQVQELPLDDISLKLNLISDLWEHGILITNKPLPQVEEFS